MFTNNNYKSEDHIDIKSISIKLALETLQMEMSAYNSLDIKQLKIMRLNNNILAVDILIHYKQNLYSSKIKPFNSAAIHPSELNLYDI